MARAFGCLGKYRMIAAWWEQSIFGLTPPADKAVRLCARPVTRIESLQEWRSVGRLRSAAGPVLAGRYLR